MFEPLPSLGGIRILASEHMPTDTVEDWSRVRSPGRAARRRRQGHPQRIGYRQEPKRMVVHDTAQNVLYVHPVIFDEIAEAIDRGQGVADAFRGLAVS
jgi:hypothetical protein